MMIAKKEIEAAAKAITEYYSSERADMTPSEYIAVMWQCYIPEAKAALEAAEFVRLKEKAIDIVPENDDELINWLAAEKVREEK